MKESHEIINACFEYQGHDKSCNRCSISTHRCEIMLPILSNKIRGVNSKGKSVPNSVQGFTDDEIRDLIAEAILGIQTGIRIFHGESDAQFICWMEKIFRNKKVDYLRRKEKEKEFQSYAEDLKKKHSRTVSGAIKRHVEEENSECTEIENHKLEDVVTHNDSKPKEKLDTKKMDNLERGVAPCNLEASSSDIDDLIGFLKEKVGQKLLCAKDIALIKALYVGNEKCYRQSEMAGEIGLKTEAFKQRKSRLIKKLEKHGFGIDVLSRVLTND